MAELDIAELLTLCSMLNSIKVPRKCVRRKCVRTFLLAVNILIGRHGIHF